MKTSKSAWPPITYALHLSLHQRFSCYSEQLQVCEIDNKAEALYYVTRYNVQCECVILQAAFVLTQLLSISNLPNCICAFVIGILPDARML